jgi:hypothetical protein
MDFFGRNKLLELTGWICWSPKWCWTGRQRKIGFEHMIINLLLA